MIFCNMSDVNVASIGRVLAPNQMFCPSAICAAYHISLCSAQGYKYLYARCLKLATSGFDFTCRVCWAGHRGMPGMCNSGIIKADTNSRGSKAGKSVILFKE